MNNLDSIADKTFVNRCECWELAYSLIEIKSLVKLKHFQKHLTAHLYYIQPKCVILFVVN